MLLKIVLLRELTDEPRAWLAAALGSKTAEELADSFVNAGRRLMGRRTISARTETELRDSGLGWLVPDETIVGLSKVALFLRALDVSPNRKSIGEMWYFAGATAERRAILRALVLTPRPKLHLDLALHAMLSSDETLFGAISLHNPYPARFFDDRCFDHMVARATERRASMRAILGLDGRRGEQLVQLAIDSALNVSDDLKLPEED